MRSAVLDLPAKLLELLAQRLQLVDRLALGLPLRGHRIRLCAEVGELLAQCLEPLLARLVLLLLERRLLDLELHHPPRDLVELLRHRVDLGTDHGAGLVDQVDRLVGEETVGDVAVGERRRRHQCSILNPDAVVDLEALAQPPQDRDRVLDCRLVDHHRLEPALERGVLLDVAPVLVQRGRPDAMQLAAGEHRLEHVAGVHRPLGRAGAHHRVQLVDEQQDPALASLDLLEHGLEPLLEFASVLRPRDQRPHVEGEDRFVLEPLGNVASDDSLREAFDDRRLSHPGIPDQHRVVLRLTRQDLDHPPDLGVAADDRVELPGARLGHQIAPVLLERLIGRLRRGAGDALGPSNLSQDLQDAVAVGTVFAQQLSRSGPGSRPPRADDREQDVLH